MWRQRELRDGTYTFQDLLDVHEYLDVLEENQRRAAEWYEQTQRKGEAY